MAHLVKCEMCAHVYTEADPARKSIGAISVIFGSLVSLRVNYCKRDEAYFTTLL